MFGIRRGMYANIVATLALVLAVSGGAYAAGKISGKQIAKNAITSKHIKDGEVHSVDLAADAKAAGPKGDTGETGAAGEMGATDRRARPAPPERKVPRV